MDFSTDQTRNITTECPPKESAQDYTIDKTFRYLLMPISISVIYDKQTHMHYEETVQKLNTTLLLGNENVTRHTGCNKLNLFVWISTRSEVKYCNDNQWRSSYKLRKSPITRIQIQQATTLEEDAQKINQMWIIP